MGNGVGLVFFLSGYQCILVISWIWYDELHGYVRSPLYPISDTYLIWIHVGYGMETSPWSIGGQGKNKQEQFRYVGRDVLRLFFIYGPVQ